MTEIIQALQSLSWPGAIAFSTFCISIAWVLGKLFDFWNNV